MSPDPRANRQKFLDDAFVDMSTPEVVDPRETRANVFADAFDGKPDTTNQVINITRSLAQTFSKGNWAVSC